MESAIVIFHSMSVSFKVPISNTDCKTKDFLCMDLPYIYLNNCGCVYVCVSVRNAFKRRKGTKASCAKHSLGRGAPLAPRMPSLV